MPDNRLSEVKGPNSGRFQKGVSGNPGGRPKAIAEVEKRLAEMSPDAMNGLAKLLKLADEDPKLFLEALQVWARYFMPVPKASEMPADPFANMSDEEILNAVQSEIQRRGQANGAPAADQ